MFSASFVVNVFLHFSFSFTINSMLLTLLVGVSSLIEHESRLQRHLFQNYSKSVLPVQHKGKPVVVTVRITLRRIHEIVRGNIGLNKKYDDILVFMTMIFLFKRSLEYVMYNIDFLHTNIIIYFFAKQHFS